MELPSSDLSSPPASPASCGQPTPVIVVTDRKRSHAEMVDTRQSKNGHAKDSLKTTALRDERSQSPTPGSPKHDPPSSPDSDVTQRQIFTSENDAPGLNGAEPDLVDPSEKIEPIDWSDLEVRYHQAMDTNIDVEDKLTQEWSSLMKFFSIWQEASKSHEVDRSFKRLRTRMAHVQHSEENLEKTRIHYIHVVRAFESALDLLNAR